MRILGWIAAVAALLVLSVATGTTPQSNVDRQTTAVNGYDTPPRPW